MGNKMIAEIDMNGFTEAELVEGVQRSLETDLVKLRKALRSLLWAKGCPAKVVELIEDKYGPFHHEEGCPIEIEHAGFLRGLSAGVFLYNALKVVDLVVDEKPKRIGRLTKLLRRSNEEDSKEA